MNNFEPWWSSASADQLINAGLLIDLWETELIALSQDPKQPANRDRALQSLGAHTKSLWQSFNLSRESIDRDYMSIDKYLSAYLAAFFIPNIERTRYALERSNVSSVIKSFLTKDTLKILDFGAGPLSSTLGFLVALNRIWTELTPKEIKLRNLEIVAVERSEKSVRLAKNWISQIIAPTVTVQIERRTSVPPESRFDVVLASNVFNEIPTKHHLKTFNMLQNSLKKDDENHSESLLLILEPGQEIHSKQLVELRDLVVAENRVGFNLIAPCPHTASCPLNTKSNRSDWCWFRDNFKAPPFQLELDRRNHINHQELAFSYLLFAQGSHKQKAKPWAVCVSDPIPLGAPEDSKKREFYFKANRCDESLMVTAERIAELAMHGTKTKLCSQSGNLIAGVNESQNGPQKMTRGKLVESPKDFELLIQERSL